MLKIRATAVCNSYGWAKTRSSAIAKRTARQWLQEGQQSKQKPNVATVINNLLSSFIFSSNLWPKLMAGCITVSSRTCVPIFIEIDLYLTNTEQKISWHSFLRHGVHVKTVIIGVRVKYNNDSHFATEGSASNFTWKGMSPPTIVDVTKLECFSYLTVKTAWSYLYSSG